MKVKYTLLFLTAITVFTGCVDFRWVSPWFPDMCAGCGWLLAE